MACRCSRVFVWAALWSCGGGQAEGLGLAARALIVPPGSTVEGPARGADAEVRLYVHKLRHEARALTGGSRDHTELGPGAQLVQQNPAVVIALIETLSSIAGLAGFVFDSFEKMGKLRVFVNDKDLIELVILRLKQRCTEEDEDLVNGWLGQWRELKEKVKEWRDSYLGDLGGLDSENIGEEYVNLRNSMSLVAMQVGFGRMQQEIGGVQQEVKDARAHLKREMQGTERSLKEEMQETEGSLKDEIEATAGSLKEEMEATGGSLSKEMRGAESSVRHEIEGLERSLDERMRHMEDSFVKRMKHIERRLPPEDRVAARADSMERSSPKAMAGRPGLCLPVFALLVALF